MDKIPTFITVNGEGMTIELPEFTCLVHQPGNRVNVPDFVEINSRNTVECMEKMTQKAWVHISTGELFQILFREVYREEDNIPIPNSIAELNNSDFGIVHIAGMIVLACEAIFQGKTRIFFRNPENHLHPKSEQRIVQMFKKMQQLLAPETDGGVATKEEK